MEKEGLSRALQYLHDNSLTIGMLITDRHKQINKFMSQSYPDIEHQYDVWHVAKGLKKKLQKAAKYTDCMVVGEWTKSITNHMYWCTASSPDGDEKVKRWKSLMDHLCNDHSNCYGDHTDLENRHKKWLIPGSKACEKVSDLITNKQLLADVRKLSSHHQTSSFESYHSVVNHFAPKLLAFSYVGIYCRLLIAVMHFNENFERPQAVTKSRREKMKFYFSKAKQGECTPKIVPVPPTYRYASELMEKAIYFITHPDERPPLPEEPPSLTSQYEHPDKDLIPLFSRYKK
ncbi:uncharacterized protein [Dysidea avara]|uniref:uncharacterized protein n=1 Tax=Dysidea avara TaxID=196820 RepID=UPI0033265B4B